MRACLFGSHDRGRLRESLIPSLFRKDLHAFDVLPACNCHAKGLVSYHISAPPTLLQMASSLGLQLWKICFANCQVVFRVSCIICHCDLSVSVGREELGDLPTLSSFPPLNIALYYLTFQL